MDKQVQQKLALLNQRLSFYFTDKEHIESISEVEDGKLPHIITRTHLSNLIIMSLPEVYKCINYLVAWDF